MRPYGWLAGLDESGCFRPRDPSLHFTLLSMFTFSDPRSVFTLSCAFHRQSAHPKHVLNTLLALLNTREYKLTFLLPGHSLAGNNAVVVLLDHHLLFVDNLPALGWVLGINAWVLTGVGDAGGKGIVGVGKKNLCEGYVKLRIRLASRSHVWHLTGVATHD
jgi:hypothetical protein